MEGRSWGIHLVPSAPPHLGSMPFHHDCFCRTTSLAAMGPADHGLKPLKPEAELTFPPISHFSQVFYHSGGNLTGTDHMWPFSS